MIELWHQVAIEKVHDYARPDMWRRLELSINLKTFINVCAHTTDRGNLAVGSPLRNYSLKPTFKSIVTEQ